MPGLLARPSRRPGAASDRLTRWIVWAAAAGSAAVVLGGWLVASPTGASPDDDYHLTSIWCSRGFREGVCLPNPGGPWDRKTFVPFPVASMSCAAYQPEVSAACQDEVLAKDPRELTLGIGGNVDRERAGLYYWAMHRFVSDDHPRAFASIRIANAALALVLLALTMALADAGLRRAVALTWLVGMLPLGVFLLTSVNTSAWGLAGLGTAWANLLTAISAGDRRRRIGAALLAGVGAAVALGSRTEALAHLLVGVAVVLLLRAARSGRDRTRTSRWRLDRRVVGAAGAAVGAVGIATWLLPTPEALSGLLAGLGDGVEDLVSRGFGDPWLKVLLEVPELWAGALGDRWGLGWLDTPMPAMTWVTVMGVFAAVAAVGLREADRARAAAAGVALAGLVLLPAVSLLAAGLVVGEQFQPRHYLPALLLVLGVAVLDDRRSPGLTLGAGAHVTLAVALALAHAAALHVNIRRYATGLTKARVWDLNADVEWWPIAIAPMTVWAAASLAFLLLAWSVLGLFRTPQPASGTARARPTE